MKAFPVVEPCSCGVPAWAKKIITANQAAIFGDSHAANAGLLSKRLFSHQSLRDIWSHLMEKYE
jgi:hypothetical protein